MCVILIKSTCAVTCDYIVISITSEKLYRIELTITYLLLFILKNHNFNNFSQTVVSICTLDRETLLSTSFTAVQKTFSCTDQYYAKAFFHVSVKVHEKTTVYEAKLIP